MTRPDWSSEDKRVWFAEPKKDESGNTYWHPSLDGGGCVFSLDVFFYSKRECLEFIKEEVVPAVVIDD